MSRIDNVVRKLKENQADAIWVTSKTNFYYISNYYTEPHERTIGLFIDEKGEPLIVLPSMEKAQLLQSGWDGAVIAYQDGEDPLALLYQFLHHSNRIPASMAVEEDHLTIHNYSKLTALFSDIDYKNASPILAELRVIKERKEYQLLKQAAQLADFAIEKGVKSIQEGKTEMEILGEIEFLLKKEGIREMAFSTMVLAGENTSSPHGNPGNNKIHSGDLILFDLGVVYEGYCSDITRTVAFQHISEELEKIYQTVLDAQLKTIEKIKVGEVAGKLDQTARTHIHEKGYGDYFPHRIGHGIGIEVHEYPSLHSANDLILKEGMAFTVEPGIYVPGRGGVRIEDQLILTDKGPELLTNYPKELLII